MRRGTFRRMLLLLCAVLCAAYAPPQPQGERVYEAERRFLERALSEAGGLEPLGPEALLQIEDGLAYDFWDFGPADALYPLQGRELNYVAFGEAERKKLVLHDDRFTLFAVAPLVDYGGTIGYGVGDVLEEWRVDLEAIGAEKPVYRGKIKIPHRRVPEAYSILYPDAVERIAENYCRYQDEVLQAGVYAVTIGWYRDWVEYGCVSASFLAYLEREDGEFGYFVYVYRCPEVMRKWGIFSIARLKRYRVDTPTWALTEEAWREDRYQKEKLREGMIWEGTMTVGAEP